MKTPILFLTFNRPEKTLRVLIEILKCNPERLYLSSDGGRNLEENKVVVQLRKKIENLIPKNCKLTTYYSINNQGCKNAVANAITRFFEQEEAGIILEDDCLPSPQFFKFCEHNLNLFKNNPEIFQISGTNLLGETRETFISKYPTIWGWATWRDRWKLYDRDLKNVNSFLEISQQLKNIFEYQYWKNLFLDTKKNKINTWDYQWVFTTWKHNGKAIIPSTNTVLNIGFGTDATHTKKEKTFDQKLYPEAPKEVLDPNINIDLDDQIFKRFYLKGSLMFKLKLLIKYYIK
jgi:hypothetical protein